ncbi:type III secretion system inner membrane ring lipoprotein SctJ [Janthinobacterium agaricidamnosum]|uniref:Lipoprotein n=1 Tax=Janthinobacterium agaricidamnosum NBRC 102515 = DSM 9628 TaxID=1349767 RepID=W0V379_9BURK|nr:type III secretion inner membrane ring lipoprotein SctJ [Janthinobacterium agaricidamnosum]CDG82326.1 conserved hypothetical protein [Janthinobacterium agaricidamnosum NBRC 102515 = DSM 9628]
MYSPLISLCKSILRAFARPRRLALYCCVFAMAMLTACSNQVNLQTGLNDADANEILSLLTRSGVDAQKVTGKDGVTLTVDAGDLSRATMSMRQAGLPRRNLSNLGAIFKKEGMISTPLEERVRYIHGLAEELEDTVQQFDHVIAARVHVVLPERVAPGEPVQPSSAAVFVKYYAPIDEDTLLPRIRNLVASSIPGLSGEAGRNKVSVILEASEPLQPVFVEWTQVGPFRVLAASSGTLMWTLGGCAALLLLVLAGLVWVLLKYHPTLMPRLRAHFGKPARFDEANAEAGEGGAS